VIAPYTSGLRVNVITRPAESSSKVDKHSRHDKKEVN
jgi:hypothetical protein